MLKSSQIGPPAKLGTPDTEPNDVFTEESKEEQIELFILEPQDKINGKKN